MAELTRRGFLAPGAVVAAAATAATPPLGLRGASGSPLRMLALAPRRSGL